MDYKDTLLLPKTSFPMRGNLGQNEPKLYEQWYENNIYKKMQQNRKNANESFTLHDGPPYANGHIHIGHALNKILKDIIVKYHYFQGKKVHYTPGWDCHGLPIEQQVEKKIGKAKKDSLPVSKFRDICRQHAAKFIEIQKKEFAGLGVVGDYENPYLTMDFAFEADIYRTLCEVAKQGLLIERNKPVYWSWAARSALAEAEVEYEDKEDYSIYVAFELGDKAKQDLGVDKAAAVIWTTTPWTLPANSGIALNPDETYVLCEDGNIIANERYEALSKEGVISGKIIHKFGANELAGKLAINPLNGRSSKLVLGDHVELGGGSGLVHTAPGHGEDDYVVGLQNDLEVLMPVDDHGRYDQSVTGKNLLDEKYVGMHVFDANEPILEELGKSLLHVSRFTHSYPHCWRTKKPIIFRATKQWFISLDSIAKGAEKPLRQVAMDEIEQTTFYPSWGANRIGSMVADRPDWCISRQRAWGVPIAFFRDKNTKEPVFDEKVLNFVAAIFEQKGADAWYDMSIEELLHPASGYNAADLEKVDDILDVWFDSGSTWNAVLQSRNYDAGDYPADLYLEGSDQHRGWFQSSLLLSSAIHHKAPYKGVLTHGFTVDEKGEKMSKSKGNVVAPEDVRKKYGSEILRLWVAMSDYQSDLKISEGILKQVAGQYKKIRNSFRFLLANIDDLDALKPVSEFGELERWILVRAKTTLDSVVKSFEQYDFQKGFSDLNNFLVNELSGIYMDISKDTLYCEAKEGDKRRAAQSAMAMIARSMLGVIAPVLSYTANEIITHAPSVVKGQSEDIFDFAYEPLPEIDLGFDDSFILRARDEFFEVLDKLKKDKAVKSSLELVLQTDEDMVYARENPKAWFMVSDVTRKAPGEELARFNVGDAAFVIKKSQKYKCPRCWNLDSDSEDTLCKRCESVLDA
ncbi:MAG: isoleucine--tRNA ligase [Campylobacterota bacterium]